jgi:hypothetical protein
VDVMQLKEDVQRLVMHAMVRNKRGTWLFLVNFEPARLQMTVLVLDLPTG